MRPFRTPRTEHRVNALLLTTIVALSTGAMPEPPTKVKYTADKGDVTFDHAAHVARREGCRSCHGEGAVQKLELDKRSAHLLCVGCHATRRVGPKGCSGCHDDA
jgi:predicted CXXCH cytochrome family protein